MKNNIKKLRKERRMTQKELAEKVGITVNWLNKIENEKGDPRIQTLAKIANALNVPIRELF